MKTKKARAEAAAEAMLNMAQAEEERDAAGGLFFWAGLLRGYANNAGYLSSAQIDTVIDEALESVDGFIHAYYKELSA